MFNRKGKFDAPASFKTGGKFHAPDGLNRIFALLALFVVIAGGSVALKFKEVKEAAGFLTTIVDATTTNKLIVNSDGSINTTPASGGSSAVTSVDGGIVTLGANADAAVGDATGTANSHLRQIAKTIVAGVPVTGTFWQATQPVSGTVAATQSGTWTVQPGNTANTTAWKVDGSAVTQPVSVASLPALTTGSATIGATTQTVTTGGGATVYTNINLGTTGISVKGSAGNVYGWYIANNAAYAIFVKFYNKATAATVGTDTPVMTLEIPANGGSNVSFAFGISFATGISVGASKLVALADTTALTTNDCVINLLYN